MLKKFRATPSYHWVILSSQVVTP
ncbi:MAG: hypothetical protein K2J70_02955, partial [Muribaculaceae bacterium]|nr:hypothetical protein [Muribaculaceae bacterium]